MQLFPLDIDVWTMAARWEFEENGNITTARGMHINVCDMIFSSHAACTAY